MKPNQMKSTQTKWNQTKYKPTKSNDTKPFGIMLDSLHNKLELSLAIFKSAPTKIQIHIKKSQFLNFFTNGKMKYYPFFSNKQQINWI